MLLSVIQLIILGLLLLFAGFLEYLDWNGRADVLKEKHPKVWAVMKSRPARLALLAACLAFLVRDFHDAAAIAPPPRFKAPPPPVLNVERPIIIQAPPNPPVKSPVAADKSVPLDRFLNTEQKEHLYQELKRVSADPRQKEYTTVTIVAAYPHDRESSRLAFQLVGVFQDAGWSVIGQQVPNYEQPMQGQIPIGIWVSASNNMALFVESSLINSGLNADIRANASPPSFKGVLILVGYKAAPF